MTTQNPHKNISVTAAQGSMIDSIIDWLDALSPIGDNLDITISMDSEDLRADLDHGRNG